MTKVDNRQQKMTESQSGTFHKMLFRQATVSATHNQKDFQEVDLRGAKLNRG